MKDSNVTTIYLNILLSITQYKYLIIVSQIREAEISVQCQPENRSEYLFVSYQIEKVLSERKLSFKQNK